MSFDHSHRSVQPQKEVKEITIKTAYGHLAAKWWGPTNVKPILCLHGWQDNAGTYDTLIPLLPDHIGYLCIDFPGHGLSSSFPHGTVYSTIDFVYLVHGIAEHFKWSKISLMGHSLGSIVAFLYGTIFPDRCDMMIGLDALTVQAPSLGYTTFILTSLDELLQMDERNRAASSEPTAFTYEEMIAKMRPYPMLDIPPDVAPYLLKRAISPSKVHPGKYYFTRDSRLKIFNSALFSQDMNVYLAGRIKCPYCFIKATDSPDVNQKEYFYESVEVLRKNPDFEIHGVTGGHHVHLIDPVGVSEPLIKFLNKHKPSANVIINKL